MVAGRGGRQEKGITRWTRSPDLFFSAQASVALGDIREDHRLERVWTTEENAWEGPREKTQRFHFYRWAKEKTGGFTAIGG